MPRVIFAPHLQRHVPCPPQSVAAPTLGAALEAAFKSAPALRGYVLDDQGHIRKHVAVFIDGRLWHARDRLDAPVAPDARIDVIQALSGG